MLWKSETIESWFLIKKKWRIFEISSHNQAKNEPNLTQNGHFMSFDCNKHFEYMPYVKATVALLF